ncbi:hypothetical protein ACQ4PT_064351 [Festuca glaucescens]
MAAPSSSGFATDPIHQAAPNEAVFTADPIYLAAVAVSVGMSGATGMPVMEMVHQPQDMPSGQQMTGFEQEIAGFNESTRPPYGPSIHNEMPYVDSYECYIPSNASNTLYVEGYLFDIHDLYSHSLHLQFSLPSPRLGDGPSW